MSLTRRRLWERCLETGALLGAASSLGAQALLGAEPVKPTPLNEMGPFYRKGIPAGGPMKPVDAKGFSLTVEGQVWNAKGDRVEGVTIEVWQADEKGIYDLEGHRYRAKLELGAKPDYRFDTIMPGHYPDRVAQHIHYYIKAPGHKPLVTQLYFATDPVFEGDPRKFFHKDPLVRNPDLIRPVTIVDEAAVARALVRFDLVLERL